MAGQIWDFFRLSYCAFFLCNHLAVLTKMQIAGQCAKCNNKKPLICLQRLQTWIDVIWNYIKFSRAPWSVVLIPVVVLLWWLRLMWCCGYIQVTKFPFETHHCCYVYMWGRDNKERKGSVVGWMPVMPQVWFQVDDVHGWHVMWCGKNLRAWSSVWTVINVFKGKKRRSNNKFVLSIFKFLSP